MKNLPEYCEEILLMGPGPSCVPPAVDLALARSTLEHMDPKFIEIMDAIKEQWRARKSKGPNWSLDRTLIMNYWDGQTRADHHTAPVNMLYGLYQALALILAEGVNQVFERHRRNHLALVAGGEALGLQARLTAANDQHCAHSRRRGRRGGAPRIPVHAPNRTRRRPRSVGQQGVAGGAEGAHRPARKPRAIPPRPEGGAETVNQ